MEVDQFHELMRRVSESRDFKRRMRIYRLEARLARALRWPQWPVLKVVWAFWTTLPDEGIRATCKPRWGMLTFAFLNDGWPTRWHTWRSITHDGDDPYTGIYVGGAPSSLTHAKTIERLYRIKR